MIYNENVCYRSEIILTVTTNFVFFKLSMFNEICRKVNPLLNIILVNVKKARPI